MLILRPCVYTSVWPSDQAEVFPRYEMRSAYCIRRSIPRLVSNNNFPVPLGHLKDTLHHRMRISTHSTSIQPKAQHNIPIILTHPPNPIGRQPMLAAAETPSSWKTRPPALLSHPPTPGPEAPLPPFHPATPRATPTTAAQRSSQKTLRSTTRGGHDSTPPPLQHRTSMTETGSETSSAAATGNTAMRVETRGLRIQRRRRRGGGARRNARSGGG